MKARKEAERRWRNKLERMNASHGKVGPIPPKMQKQLGAGTLLIPEPLDVDALMRKPKKGQLITLGQIRKVLAARAGADTTCALCTGIFVRIAAETSEEDFRFGQKRVTPYWRTIRDDGSLMEKFPGGTEKQAAQLRREGFKVLARKGSKKLRVEGFEEALLPLR